MAVLLFIMRSALGTPAPAFQPTAGRYFLSKSLIVFGDGKFGLAPNQAETGNVELVILQEIKPVRLISQMMNVMKCRIIHTFLKFLGPPRFSLFLLFGHELMLFCIESSCSFYVSFTLQ